MNGLLKTFMVIAILMLFCVAVTATIAYWPYDWEPRAFAPLRWIVATFVTGPFGDKGTLVWLGLFASPALLLGIGSFLRNKAPVSSPPQKERREDKDPNGLAERRRRIVRGAGAIAPSAVKTNAEPEPYRAPHETLTRQQADELPASGITPDDLAGLFILDREISPLPAWRLVPIPEAVEPATPSGSWIGGTPCTPPDFRWPVTKRELPMLFLAQIDLAEAARCARDNDLPTGLPDSGAMLVFIGAPSNDEDWEYQIRILSEDELASAVPTETPDDAVSPRDIGWAARDDAALQCTRMQLEYFIDSNSDEPVAKLFGVEVEDPYGFHYPEDFRCLFYLAFDENLGTRAENWFGMSIACAAAEVKRGAFNGGRIFGSHKG